MGASLALSACGGQQPPPAAAPQEEAAPPVEVGGHPECVDTNENPVRCVDDKECCKGLVCGQDPELNPMNKYCVYAGG